MKRFLSSSLAVAALLSIVIWNPGMLSRAACDKPECGTGKVEESFENKSDYFETEEEAQAAQAQHPGSTMAALTIGGIVTWVVSWTERIGGVTPCPDPNDQPPADSPKNDPGSVDLTEPAEEDGSSSCASCGGSSSSGQLMKQNAMSPTAMNLDLGLGRDAAGKPLGRLRFGFDMVGGAGSLRQALSLDYKPQEGKFVLDQFQANATTIEMFTSPTDQRVGRPKTMTNSNTVITFAWEFTNNVCTSVLIHFAPASGVIGTSREFQPVSVTLNYSTQGPFGIQPNLEIVQHGTITQRMKIFGTATSRTEYAWTVERLNEPTSQPMALAVPTHLLHFEVLSASRSMNASTIRLALRVFCSPRSHALHGRELFTDDAKSWGRLSLPTI